MRTSVVEMAKIKPVRNMYAYPRASDERADKDGTPSSCPDFRPGWRGAAVGSNGASSGLAMGVFVRMSDGDVVETEIVRVVRSWCLSSKAEGGGDGVFRCALWRPDGVCGGLIRTLGGRGVLCQPVRSLFHTACFMIHYVMPRRFWEIYFF